MEGVGESSTRVPPMLFPHQQQMLHSLSSSQEPGRTDFNHYHQAFSMPTNVNTFGSYAAPIAMSTPLSTISVMAPENFEVERFPASQDGQSFPYACVRNSDQRTPTRRHHSHNEMPRDLSQKCHVAQKSSQQSGSLLPGERTVSNGKIIHTPCPLEVGFQRMPVAMQERLVNNGTDVHAVKNTQRLLQMSNATPQVPCSSTQVAAPHSATAGTRSSTDYGHEMQQHHFQKTIAKARQIPTVKITTVSNILPDTPTSSDHDTGNGAVARSNGPCLDTNADSQGKSMVQVDLGNPLQNMVLVSVLAAVTAKAESSGPAVKKSETKKKKNTKKQSLKLKLPPGLPTMVPQSKDPPDKSIQCPECPKKFYWHFQLHLHARSHSNERPFVCRDCNQSYKRREHLQRHERVHTGERPFECEDCGKKYRRRSQLVRHSRVHTGERPYVCSICSKSFRRKGHLCRHAKTHANEILKKSGVNSASLEEATALLNATMATMSKSTVKTRGATSRQRQDIHQVSEQSQPAGGISLPVVEAVSSEPVVQE